MPNIIDILARAQSLMNETALNSITPPRAGGIMYDTLLVLNQMQLEGASLLISKVYASVSAMEADTTPTSDLTGRALKPGQLVVIVTSDTSSSDMGSEYRYNGPGSWTYVGKVGGLPLDTAPTQSSTKGITSGGVYAALSAMKAEGYKYMGIATPGSGGTAPVTPNQPVFYIAGPGSYPNFGSITVASGYLGFLKYSSGSWTVESVAVGKDYDDQITSLDGQISQLEAEVAKIKDETETGLGTPLPASPTEITSLSIGTSGITFNSSTSASSVYYIPVTKGQHIFYKASSSSSKVLRFAFCLDVPAEDVVFTGVERYNLASYDYERIAPFDGYFAVYHLNNALSNQEFKVGTPTALGQRVVALEESSAESEEFREGSIVDKTSSFIGGYYNMADKSQGDLLRPFASSEIYYTAKIAIKKGQVVRCNTEYIVTSSIRHCLITDDNRIVEYVSRASVNDGYTISDEAIAAGGVYLLVVYNADTQLKPISLTISDTYGFIQEEIRKNDGAKLYADKSVILCGDSILGQAQGVDGMIQDIIGGNILNCGFGGCRMSWRTADGSSPWDAFSMVNIADCLVSGNFSSMEAQTDIIESYPYFATAINKLKSVAMTDGKDVVITIAYGANDFTGNALLGNLNDEDKTTYIGALGYAVDKLMTAFPRLVILIVSTWYRVFDYETDPVTEEKTIVTDSDNKVRSDGETSDGFNNALKSASETLKLPFFDVYHRGGINKYNIFTLRPDGTHPTTSAGKHSEAEVYSKILQSF